MTSAVAAELKVKSRIARRPIPVPLGVEVKVDGRHVKIKGSKGAVDFALSPVVSVAQVADGLQVGVRHGDKFANAMAGTTFVLLRNTLHGVSQGFEKKLLLVGVGYRAQVKGKSLDLTLGLSHPTTYTPPAGITLETPSNTEILIKGIDKQLVGQVAAEIRRYRTPERYKGKGIRYSDEKISLKETKKK